jgi:hypothetical protein
VLHHRNLVEADRSFLERSLDSLVVVEEVADSKAERLRDKIAVAEGVDHNLVDRRHLPPVQDHLAVDNN